MLLGIVSMFTFHILVNVGMTSNVMPVTGVPLPFMSYGVSSLTTNMLMVAHFNEYPCSSQDLEILVRRPYAQGFTD